MPRNNSRRYCRLPLESTVFIELESPPPGGLGPGKVVRCQTLEVSRWGIRVQIDQRVTVGAILQIGVDIPGNDEPFYLVGQVRWRMQEQDQPGSWIAGFEILNAAGSDLEHWERALQVMEVREDG